MSITNLMPADMERLAELVAEKLDERLAGRPRLCDRVELAKQLGIGVATVERRTKEGLIPHLKIGRRVLYSAPDVIAALEAASEKKEPATEESGPDQPSAMERARRRMATPRQ